VAGEYGGRLQWQSGTAQSLIFNRTRGGSLSERFYMQLVFFREENKWSAHSTQTHDLKKSAFHKSVVDGLPKHPSALVILTKNYKTSILSEYMKLLL